MVVLFFNCCSISCLLLRYYNWLPFVGTEKLSIRTRIESFARFIIYEYILDLSISCSRSQCYPSQNFISEYILDLSISCSRSQYLPSQNFISLEEYHSVLYCLSKKSRSNSCSKLLYIIGQDFLDSLYKTPIICMINHLDSRSVPVSRYFYKSPCIISPKKILKLGWGSRKKIKIFSYIILREKKISIFKKVLFSIEALPSAGSLKKILFFATSLSL